MITMQRNACLAVLAILGICSTTAAYAAEPVNFNRDIRPIMADTCFRCHGPDEKARMAGMRLDIREEAILQRAGGVTPIVPKYPEKSAIIERIFSQNASRIMPPSYSGKTLTSAQKELVRQWVAQGAVYQKHWAYEVVTRPPVPALRRSGVPIRNPIDAFVQQKLTEKKLRPSPEADRRTLLRRVTLDLTGLPPMPEEINAFLKDSSPRAYEKVVERLLSSPRYAEKQTTYWLDAVRFTDTAGFHGDNPYPVWPYRDWVLRAFRDNKPFDQFTIEQLAGDLLPGAAIAQRVASAYNRLNRVSAEGGIQDKEYLAKYAADRVRTTSITWLGMTVGCAECHNHKFDPILAKDFYAMKAFFADIKETGFTFDNGPNAWGAQLSLPSDAQRSELQMLQKKLLDAKKDLEEKTKVHEARRLAWEKETVPDWTYQRPLLAIAANGATLTVAEDGVVAAGGPNPDNETYTITIQPGRGAWKSLGIQVPEDESLPGQGLARGADRLVITEVEVEVAQRRLPLILAASNVKVASPEHLPMAAIDGDKKTGWGVSGPGNGGTVLLALRFAEDIITETDSVLTIRLRHDSPWRRATTGKFRIALSSGDAFPEAKKPKERRTLAHFQWSQPELQPLLANMWKLEAHAGRLESEIPRVMVSEATSPRETRVLPRGNWMDESGAIVEPAIPEFFGKLNTGSIQATRLDLANWITSPQNPLTARVFANRLWRQFFGTGISRTLDDFGSRGEQPAHAALLDWLAAEFMKPTLRHGSGQALGTGTHAWNVKHLVRVIVTSHAYRQSSLRAPALEKRDPENRFYARQNVFRVEAEAVRDNALAASGLLVDRFGGPSVWPYQPDGYLAAMNYPKREWSASRGEDLYRRSLYTFWQRTFLHPTLLTFDAPLREECTVNRESSNTPLQALILLNDPIFVEASRVLAQHMQDLRGQTVPQKIAWAFERATGRRPMAHELRTLTELYAKSKRQFRANPREAEKLLQIGEFPQGASGDRVTLAALSAVARTVLNLHEVITRE